MLFQKLLHSWVLGNAKVGCFLKDLEHKLKVGGKKGALKIDKVAYQLHPVVHPPHQIHTHRHEEHKAEGNNQGQDERSLSRTR